MESPWAGAAWVGEFFGGRVLEEFPGRRGDTAACGCGSFSAKMLDFQVLGEWTRVLRPGGGRR